MPFLNGSNYGGPLAGYSGGGGMLSGRGLGLLDPQYALPIAAQLIGGATPAASFAGALGAAGPAIGDMRRRAAMNAYLKAHSGLNLTPEEQQLLQSDPELQRAFVARQLTPTPPTWGVIGKDSSGAEQYGWIQPTTQTVTPVAAPGGSGAGHIFPGTSVEASALNWLVDNGKLTQDQAAQLAASKQVSGADGTIYLATPEGIFGKPPGGGPAVPVGQEPPQDGSDAGGAGAGMIPIGKAKLTESMVKSGQNYNLAKEQLPIIRENYDQLASLSDQAADTSVATRWLTTAKYQRAKNAVTSMVSSYLYSVSGATVNPDELQRNTAVIMPFPGESKESIADKKSRIETMVEGIKQAAQGKPVSDEIKKKVGLPGAAPADAQAGGAQEGDVATLSSGPSKGHQIVVKGGQWVDAQTGQPIQ